MYATTKIGENRGKVGFQNFTLKSHINYRHIINWKCLEQIKQKALVTSRAQQVLAWRWVSYTIHIQHTGGEKTQRGED